MKKIFFLILIIIIPNLSSAQISGTVKDSLTNEVLPFVNVWIKGKFIGGTTDQNGNFTIEQSKENDTLIISYLGFEKKEINAKKGIVIFLKDKPEELEEVIIVPMKAELEFEVNSYKRAKKNREYLSSGKGFQYSVAKYFPNKSDYKKTPFIKEVNFVTNNALNESVAIKINILKADKNGRPTENHLLKNYITNAPKGVNEISVDLITEKILIPNNGFFVVLERLYIEKNRLPNKYYKKNKNLIEYSYQPTIGMVNNDENKNTWWYFGGAWNSINELQKRFTFDIKDIAVNIKLTN